MLLLLLACRMPSGPTSTPPLEVAHPVDRDGDGALAEVDCDDDNPQVHPSAEERCNGVDDDCDGEVDLADPGLIDAYVGFLDADGDGVGSVPLESCAPLTTASGDCDDAEASVFPGAEESCNGVDDDCDGAIDEEVLLVGYLDADGDGWGGAANMEACVLDAGFVPLGGDCDDLDPDVHPEGEEHCDGLDNDCDGSVDGPFAMDAVVQFEDADLDGFGSEVLIEACPNQLGASEVDGDCDDADPTTWPNAPELCDGVDNDCDRHPDRMDPAFEGTDLGCDLCPNEPDPVLEIRSVNPCLLDPEATFACHDGVFLTDTHAFGRRLHRAARRDAPVHRPKTMLYLPPSGALHSQALPQWMAASGFRVVLLDWYPAYSLPRKLCLDALDPEVCKDQVLAEAVFGGDPSDQIDVPPGNVLVRELSQLLLHLDSVDPGHGWGDALLPDGSVDFGMLEVVAWSKGVAAGAQLAERQSLGGLTALGVEVSSATEIFTRPWATVGPDVRLVGHVDEWALNQDVLETVVATATATDLGFPVDLDGTPGPWPDESGFTISSGIVSPDCVPHSYVAADDCMDVPALEPAYRTLFCSF